MSNILAKYLSAYIILAGGWSAGFKYLTKHHLKHSLSSIFSVLINPFRGWSNSFGNLVQLHPGKRLYFEILIVWLMTESIIQPEPFHKHLCIFDIICSIEWLKHIINVIFIDNYFCFSVWIKSATVCFTFTFKHLM